MATLIVERETDVTALKDASHLYPVQRRARYAERPGFRISELQLGPDQRVPWHKHTNVQDAFYVLEGELRLSLRGPEEVVTLHPGDTYSAVADRPHLVENPGPGALTFFIMQGIGEYDYVPLE
ncbi:MAG: quercetin dioxygenase-like cupin family protein [Gammaproteobacteria bacterium]|jgi:quercetin dioxygenase-like cupin family protein